MSAIYALIGKNVPERLLDMIEDDLAQWSDEMGLPYIRPELSQDGQELLLDSPMRFIKRYVGELRRTVRDNFNYVQV